MQKFVIPDIPKKSEINIGTDDTDNTDSPVDDDTATDKNEAIEPRSSMAEEEAIEENDSDDETDNADESGEDDDITESESDINEEMNENEDNTDIEADDNGVLMEIKKSISGFDEDFEKNMIYNKESGWLESVQIKNTKGEIVLEYNAVPSIPGYDLSIFIGLTIVMIGLIDFTSFCVSRSSKILQYSN